MAVTRLGLPLFVLLCACSDAHDSDATDGEPPYVDASGCRPDADVLLGGGRTLGICPGECNYSLALSSSIALGDGTCIGYKARMQVTDARNFPLYIVTADLADGAWERAAIAGAGLDPDRVPENAACPECADAGEGWVVTRTEDGQPKRHRYRLDEPPRELVAAHAVVQSLIDQLRACEGADILSCSRE
jgi:hypothetical protein